jgi:acyl carrier protein
MTPSIDIKALIAGFLRQPPAAVDEHADLTTLVTDSFALVELAVHLQEETDTLLERDDFEGIRTVGDLITLFEAEHGS